MSDPITVKGEQYFHVSYLRMANDNCERRDEEIKRLRTQLASARDAALVEAANEFVMDGNPECFRDRILALRTQPSKERTEK